MGNKEEKKGKIAVILSVYKGDSVTFLKECIDSLLNQTIANIDVIIGVDGAVDKLMADSIASYEGDGSVRVIRFSENRGLAAVLNDLIEICKEEGYGYLARMDADDICTKERMKLQLAYLKNHPEVDVVGGTIEEIDGESNLRGKKVSYPLSHKGCKKMF